jgi:hypothetical protein
MTAMVRPVTKDTVMSTSNTSKASALTRVQALIAGTQKHFPNGQFTLGGASYTSATLVQAFQGLVDAFAPVDAAHAKVRDTVAALRATKAKVAPLMRAYLSFLRGTFSNAAQLSDFGLPAPKAQTALVTEKRVAATVKLRATRKARGTTGKKQKLAVKGDVAGVNVTPVTHAQSATPPATPAGPAPTATANSSASK